MSGCNAFPSYIENSQEHYINGKHCIGGTFGKSLIYIPFYLPPTPVQYLFLIFYFLFIIYSHYIKTLSFGVSAYNSLLKFSSELAIRLVAGRKNGKYSWENEILFLALLSHLYHVLIILLYNRNYISVILGFHIIFFIWIPKIVQSIWNHEWRLHERGRAGIFN